MEVLPVLQVFLTSFALGLFSTSSPNAENDVTGLKNDILRVEQTLSDLQSKSQTQDQKYAAILSSVLSKLTETTDDLTKVKSELKDTKDQNRKLQDELEKVKAKVNNNEKYITVLSDKFNSTLDVTDVGPDLNVSEKRLEPMMIELTSVKADLQSSVRNMTHAMSEMTGEVREMNATVTVMQKELETVKSEVKGISSEQTNLKTQLSTTDNVFNVSQSPKIAAKYVAFEAEHTSHYPSNTPNNFELRYRHVKYNYGNRYNPNDGYFTAPVNGVYLFWMAAIISSKTETNSTVTFQVQAKSGLLGSAFEQLDEYERSETISVFAVANLTIGDNVWFSAEYHDGKVHFSDLPRYGGALLGLI